MVPMLSLSSFSQTSLSLLAALLLTLTLVGCNGSDTADESTSDTPRALPVDVYTVQTMDFEDRLQVTGTLRALDDATISAEIGGTLLSRHDLGREVAANERVATIDPSEVQAAVRQAEAQLQSAETQRNLAQDAFTRQEPLHRDSIISAIEFERVQAELSSAEAGVAQAQSALDQARERLRRTRITAPFAGRVEAHFAQRGEQVTPGMPIIRIVDTDSMRAEIGVAERYMGQLQVGTAVEATFRAYPGETFEGRTLFVGRTIAPGSRTIPVEVAFPNVDGRLRPAMTARVAIPLETFSDVVVIPQRATVDDDEGTLVYVVGEDNRVGSRIIETGPSFEGKLVVLDGLSPDEHLVVAGQGAISGDDRVEVRQTYATLDDALMQPRSTQASR
jgi:membrane fusion protein, multidrug efflux system